MDALGDTGWQPMKPKRAGAESFVVTPFMRLARTHAVTVAGDTMLALALADSLFFSISPTQARSRVALGLALTMAPFALVAPLIGPWLDRVRGGRRWVLVGANALRALIAVMMIGHLDSLLLFPEAFSMLVLSKSYHVAKSALVPTVVASDDELVAANSRLTLLSGIVTALAGIVGGIAVWIAAGQGPLFLAVIAFAMAALLGTQIPATRVAPSGESTLERDELRSAGIRLAASAMAILRGIVGFLTFLLAFEFRGDGELWILGLAVAASAIGSPLGALVAPALRQSHMPEERMLQVFLGVTGGAALVIAAIGEPVAAVLLAGVIGLSGTTCKLAFDAIVQRDAPDANRGRAFARFETRFQMVWVIGAIVPVVVHIPVRLGLLIIAAGAAFALVSYLAGARAVARGQPVPRPIDTKKLLQRPLEARSSRRARRRERAAAEAVPAALAMTSDRPDGADGLDWADGPNGVDGADGSDGRDPTSVTETSGELPALPPPPPPPPPPPRYVPEPENGQGHARGNGTPARKDDDTTIVVDPTQLF